MKFEATKLNAKRLRERTQFHLKYSRGKDKRTATHYDKYWSFSHAIRDLVMDRFIATQQDYLDQDVKRVYYLSLEYLIGRLLKSNLMALNILSQGREALDEMGLSLDEILQKDVEAGLGNGGLGRLAACYMESLASLKYPAYGYGLRYEHGIFRQEFENGWQLENPDNWLSLAYPWEMIRPENTQHVKLYGHLQKTGSQRRGQESNWVDYEIIEGVPYDIPIIGYQVDTVNMLRLWRSQACHNFHLAIFNRGDYVNAVEDKNWAERITKVLYPSDDTQAGRELRLIQEYFLASCTISDILRRYEKNHSSWERLPEKVALHINDTHPAITLVELMNRLCYEKGVPWEKAWKITQECFGYTNHTLLPEAQEEWPEHLMKHILPRHLDIIYKINSDFLGKIRLDYPADEGRVQRLSLFEENHTKRVKMVNLAVLGSQRVNGVSQLHTRLLREKILPDFDEIWPDKIINITNGITHRRWLIQSNPRLSDLIESRIGSEWISNPDELCRLSKFSEESNFQSAVQKVKRENKEDLAKLIYRETKIEVNCNSIFDVHVKRLHMYKRQLLNAMHIIALYQSLKDNPHWKMVPRTFIFGAKAAPAYHMAKLVIKLINTIANQINNDPELDGRLKVVFLPDYNVSLAEKIIPAADISEQISTAGWEASGTSNMKLALNGALTMGTWDGANIEIAEAVGKDNLFIFGHRAEELAQMREEGYNPWSYYDNNPVIFKVMEAIRNNSFDPAHPHIFEELFEELTTREDPYSYLADFVPYLEAQKRASQLYRDPKEWFRKTILNIARMGSFSSDRCIKEYAQKIWGISPLT